MTACSPYRPDVLRRPFRFALLAMATLVITGTSACTSTAKLPLLPRDATLLAFGDSITYGTGAAPGESYPAILEGLIGRRTVNSGIPGEISAEGLARLAAVLDREKPALLILCHGGNDLLRQLSRETTADNLRAMIRLAKEREVAVILVGVPAPDLSLSPPPLYRDVAREAGIPYEGKVLAKILGKGSLKSDYIHPNAAGYRVMAAAIEQILKKNGAL